MRHFAKKCKNRTMSQSGESTDSKKFCTEVLSLVTPLTPGSRSAANAVLHVIFYSLATVASETFYGLRE